MSLFAHMRSAALPRIQETYRLPTDYHALARMERYQVREQYIRLQKGLCWHCQHELDGPAAPYIGAVEINDDLFPDGFFTHPIHLHHDHLTGLTYGAVHAQCNAVLWQEHGE